MLSIIPKYSQTNMSAEDIIKYGYMFSKIDKSKIKFYTIKGDPEYIDDVSYFIYDEKKNNDVLLRLHNESALNK
jgi:anionic cell wall polymer biosynthesis LytR-Cps2A-Psr (LCP) family protein